MNLQDVAAELTDKILALIIAVLGFLVSKSLYFYGLQQTTDFATTIIVLTLVESYFLLVLGTAVVFFFICVRFALFVVVDFLLRVNEYLRHGKVCNNEDVPSRRRIPTRLNPGSNSSKNA